MEKRKKLTFEMNYALVDGLIRGSLKALDTKGDFSRLNHVP